MLICIKGAGDLASGVAVRLHRSCMDVVMTDLPVPMAVRRSVAFSEAIRLGKTSVEDVDAERAETEDDIKDCLSRGVIPVVTDPEAEIINTLKPDVVIDAILAKRNLGTSIDDAPLVIALGPGFTAGVDCNAVIETKRGHSLGRVILEGSAIPNTGVPGNVGGQTINRLIKASADGIFHPEKNIGDLVRDGERVANVDGVPVYALTSGMIRGMLQDGVHVTKGLKSGDVDPRGRTVDYMTVSDKATAIGGGVLEAILRFNGGLNKINY
ncbi:MAG: EF2563 family selenium-dependent molybdenum hydroxylase system protein [Mogibacterium sp.]|nr:EF2563 family selenium-dependent molybdenum hydroxylase system protein [Mogibacterium sp.]